MSTWLYSRLQPPYLKLMAGAVICVGMGLAVISYLTARQGNSAVGIPWGADFAGFYVAAQILDQHDPAQLYDRSLHARLYHELLPALPAEEIIPYVHPPFVAGLFRLLTPISYNTAVVIWMVISLALYVAGIVLVLKTCPNLFRDHRWLVLLLACSFEPFLFECWLGGQLSAIAFFSYALAWHCMYQQRTVLTGMALGICFYKPTLLILILPLLLIARLWRILLGLILTGLLLAIVSMLIVGWDCSINYLKVLVAFRQSTVDDMALRTWKYVDFNHFYQLLIGNNVYKTLAMVLTSLLCFAILAIPSWLRWPTTQRNRSIEAGVRTATWAMTLYLIPIVNIYLGIYDTILAVQGSILATELILHQYKESPSPLHQSRWSIVLLLLAVTPWFSQFIARYGGVQVYSVVLLLCAVSTFELARSIQSSHARLAG